MASAAQGEAASPLNNRLRLRGHPGGWPSPPPGFIARALATLVWQPITRPWVVGFFFLASPRDIQTA